MLEMLKKEFTNVEEAKKELRNVQSKKCRFAKKKDREDYDQVMTELLKREQALKELVKFYEPKKVFVTQFTKEDIEELDYEETLKAIKSIQSRKCNTNYPELEDEYQKACKIEAMLLEHKIAVKPADSTTVKKSQVQNLINHIQSQKNITKKEMISYLERLINEEDFMMSTK